MNSHSLCDTPSSLSMKMRSRRALPPPNSWTSTISIPSGSAAFRDFRDFVDDCFLGHPGQQFAAIKKWAFAHCSRSTVSLYNFPAPLKTTGPAFIRVHLCGSVAMEFLG